MWLYNLVEAKGASVHLETPMHHWHWQIFHALTVPDEDVREVSQSRDLTTLGPFSDIDRRLKITDL